MTNPEDETYIERIKQDDPKALEQLFQKYYYSLCHFAKSFVKSPGLSEEIVSDVFLNIWQNRKNLKISHNLKAYLFIAIKNQSINMISKNKFSFDELEIAERQQNLSDITAESSLTYLETKKEIEAIIEELPPQRKVIFRLNRLEGFKYKEIADILHISVNTVQKQMVEAVKHISQYESQFFATSILYAILLAHFS